MGIEYSPDTPTDSARRLDITMTDEELDALYAGGGSQLILVIGPPGSGKTTAARTLPPEHSIIVQSKWKMLPFPSGFKDYKANKNIFVEQLFPDIKRRVVDISRTRKEVRYILVDDGQFAMAEEFMQKILTKGYDKFSIMARNVWEFMLECANLRDGLKIFLTWHEDETELARRMKFFGKLLGDNLAPEGLPTIVLFAGAQGTEAGKSKHFLQTLTDGKAVAKSPMGMFPAYIPNDYNLVAKRIDEYYSGVHEWQRSAYKAELEAVQISNR